MRCGFHTTVARICICQAFTRRDASVFHPRDGKIGQHALRLADRGSRHYALTGRKALSGKDLVIVVQWPDMTCRWLWKNMEIWWMVKVGGAGMTWGWPWNISCASVNKKIHIFFSFSGLFLSRLACCLDSKITLSLLSSRLWCSMTLEPAIGHTHTSYWQEHRCILAECTNRHIEKDRDTPTHRHSDTRKHANTRTNRQTDRNANKQKQKNRPQKALVTHIFDSKKRKYRKIFHNCCRRSSAMASCHYGAPP